MLTDRSAASAMDAIANLETFTLLWAEATGVGPMALLGLSYVAPTGRTLATMAV